MYSFEKNSVSESLTSKTHGQHAVGPRRIQIESPFWNFEQNSLSSQGIFTVLDFSLRNLAVIAQL